MACRAPRKDLHAWRPLHADDYYLEEEFVRAKDKGAIACFVPASMVSPFVMPCLISELLNSVFQDGHRLLGLATTEAKLNAYVSCGVSGDVVQNFVLLGDPYSELKASETSDACTMWSEVISKYNDYINGQAA